MILYFLRHGISDPPGRGPDEVRQLTAEGIEALRAAVPVWRRLNLRPDVVISSPLPRAVETARLLGEGLGLDRDAVTSDRLRPGASWEDLGRTLAEHPDARRVLFVGHEPDLSAAIARLTGAASVRMRQGGLACVEFYGVPEPGGGELAWLVDPDLYSQPQHD